MAVTLDAIVSDVTSNSVTTKSLTTLTVGTGSNRALVVVLTVQPFLTGITVVWDSGGTNQAMTLIGTVEDTNTTAVFGFYGLVAPTSGNKTLTASWTGTSDVTLAAASFTGVNQTGSTTTFANFTSATAAGTSGSQNVSSATGNYAFGGWLTFAAFSSVSATQWYMDSTPTHFSSAASYATGSSTVTFTQASSPTEAWGFAGFNLVAYSPINASKIVSYAVIDQIAIETSKIVSYAVIEQIVMQSSKIVSYAVLQNNISIKAFARIGSLTVSAFNPGPGFAGSPYAVSFASSGNAGASSIYMSKVALINGETVSAVLLNTTASFSGQVKAVIYDSAHNALVGVGASIVTSLASGYNRLPLASSVSLAAGTYYVGYVTGASGGVAVSIDGSQTNSSWFVSGGQSVTSPANPLVGGSVQSNGLAVALEFDVTVNPQTHGFSTDYTSGVAVSPSTQIATTTGSQTARSVVTHTTGEWYAELVVTSGSINSQLVGLSTANFTMTAPSFVNGICVFYIAAGVNGNVTGTITPAVAIASGDTLGIAFDATNSLLWFNKNNGAWGGVSGTPNPVTGTGGFAFPASNWPITVSIGGGSSGTATFDLRDYAAIQSFAPPSGFSAWSSFAPNVTATLTGVTATTHANAPTITGSKTLAGVTAHASVNALTPSISNSVSLTGVTAHASVNPPAEAVTETVSLSGVTATASVHALTTTVSGIAHITGATAHAQVNSLAATVTGLDAITGVTAFAKVNPIFTMVTTNLASASITGVRATAKVFAISQGHPVSIVGVTAHATVNALAPFTYKGNDFLLGTVLVDANQPESSDGTLTMTYSDTGGYSWSDPLTASIGDVGTYWHNIQFRRLGYARNRIFRLSWSLSRPTALVGVFLHTSESST